MSYAESGVRLSARIKVPLKKPREKTGSTTMDMQETPRHHSTPGVDREWAVEGFPYNNTPLRQNVSKYTRCTSI